MTLGAITLAKSLFGHVHQKSVVDGSRGVDDSADRPAAVSRCDLLSHVVHLCRRR